MTIHCYANHCPRFNSQTRFYCLKVPHKTSDANTALTARTLIWKRPVAHDSSQLVERVKTPVQQVNTNHNGIHLIMSSLMLALRCSRSSSPSTKNGLPSLPSSCGASLVSESSSSTCTPRHITSSRSGHVTSGVTYNNSIKCYRN